MTEKTKGIMISAWGKRGYIYAAYNLAFSLKNFNRRLPIALYCDQTMLQWLRADCFDVFDEIIPIDVSILTQFEKSPAHIKISAYDHLPFDYTLLLDVDALALKDVEPAIDELIQEEGYFYTHIFNLHTLEQGNDIPHMVWARANDIWAKYDLPTDAVLPCSNSSIQFIKKGEDSKRLFERVRRNLDNPIPLSSLKTQWGGTQPDELYLNVAMAQEKITGKPKKEYIFMGYSLSPDPLHKIVEKYYILSVFGGKGFTKLKYTEWYDKLNIVYHRQHGKAANYKYPVIVRDKHANTKPQRTQGVSRFQVDTDKHIQEVFTNGNTGELIHLYSGWFKAKDAERQKELDECLMQNLNNKEIDQVFVVGEDECSITHPKLIVIQTERPTYTKFFQYINQNATQDTISMICNGDIYIDEENARKLRAINFHNRVLALSRWEVDVNNRARHFSYEWSQDVWILRGQVRAGARCDHTLGLMKCDNRVASELRAVGYEVVNPSKDIKTFHLHKTGIRTYDVHASLEGDISPVKPTGAKDYLKKRMLIIQPGKVGDIIICAPIALFFSDEYIIDWHCPKAYHTLFTSLPYATPIMNYVEKHYSRIIDLSFGLGGKPEKWWQSNKERFNSFVEAKYELAGLPFQLKKEFSWKRNKTRENALYEIIKKEHKFDYILVHDSSDYGTPISVEGKHVVKFQPILDYTIFDWYKVIMNAKEIHCIDSSLCNFVDVIPDVPGKLFYYKTDRVPNKWDETLLTKEWRYEVSFAN